MADMSVGKLHAGDLAVIVVYLAGSLALGLFTIFKNKTSIEGLFLANRSMTWWPIGLSLFASNIGSVNYVGIAGDAAKSGLSVVLFEWNAVFLLVLLGWIFLPVYIASGIYTMPEYLSWRFGGKRLRIYLSVVALLTYIFATVSADLYSGALFLRQSLELNLYAAVAILLAIGLIFTGMGGMETVIITDSLAVFVMVIGGLTLCALGFSKVGGFRGLMYNYDRSISDTALLSNSTCGYPDEMAWHIYRHPWFSNFPSVGLVLRTTFGSLWYWCANQVLVQRALAAKNITHAKAGCLLAGYLKLLPMFLMVLPGMISRALYPNEVGCSDPDVCMEVCGSRGSCSNIALPKLVIELLPIGIRGLLVASVMAAVVSSLTSILNSASAIFTMDIWSHIRKNASEKELIVAGRVWTLIMVAISYVWIPVMDNTGGEQIFQYATTVGGYLGAPTCAMFVLAMFWGRVNEQGAFWGMVIAQLWGISRFILDMIYPAPPCGEPDNRPRFITGFHPYYHTISQIVLAFLLAAIISLATKAPPKERRAGLTYWTRFEKPLRDKEREERMRLKKQAEITKEKNKIDEQYQNDPVIKYRGPSDSFSSNKEDKSTNSSEQQETEHLTIRQRFAQAIFGSSGSKNEDQDELIEDHKDRVASIRQPPFWKNIINANMILLLVITVFLNGFFY